MYWLHAGRVFDEKSLVAFAGVHDMKEAVYCVSDQPALATLTDCPVQEEMDLKCTGAKAINSLQMTLDQIGLMRIVNSSKPGVYLYCEVWMVTHIEMLSESQALVSMIDMTAVV